MAPPSSPPSPPSSGSWPTDDSNDRSRSPSRSNDGIPLGLWIIVGIGFLGVLLGLFASLALIGEGAGTIGVLLLALTTLEVVVLIGLLGLRSWALVLALVVYSFGALFDLLTGELLGFVVSVVIIGYLLSISGRFE
ncbi:uncharacterized protein Nmag_2948 [Natrialba magadii ATCC 43099]|uniref:Uncharacterized protein n=1 Tax=Natrialba magadii (strain ATCC 43099 / DSM 3394 / CCM 3739 / CIP 104546 / IAM 13178 / JCM 8861 / NBRC 102185 / NCIMB 2190 / MS3) TaxID=547559 RepID=D3T0M1_NATMM|nr:hypothetical protein [Natrialba magadii]ADD06500.1 uncharacterized protein Nmag_2948 [Natrialba magadii ATCC 43099]ELY32037.1 hypothetical protein C500_05648 [Natrialba magadii ATCC 43099]